MRFGICILPQYDWPEAARLWRGAEAYGFDHAWTYDHLSWRSLAGERWHATVPTLTAAAIVTERIELGTFVASPNFRHPVPFAKDIATVDQIAGGRVLLGVGSGGTGFDAFVLGQRELTPTERFERFAEFTEALDVLLRHETVDDGAGGATDAAASDSPGISFDGDWYTAVDARMVGAPAQSPRMPLLIAADGPKAMALAVRLGDGWVTTAGSIDDTDEWWAYAAKLSRRLDGACEAAGRDAAGMSRTLLLDSSARYALESVGAFEDAVGRAAELGFTDVVVHWPRADGIYAGSEAVLDEVASRLPGLR
ncbi:LLM class flavin-dependent oxidoreductase [Agromyces sp. NPDC058110]|uniref:LLM class flavin-dependent oxidoreductase n=1 Tax=Agromyces sp. NPDC058110 TaxID=3346345 RepID=UPI0036D85965